MSAGDQFTITEIETEYYVSSSLPETGEVVLEEGKMSAVEFVNRARGTGHLTVGKVIEHDLGVQQTMTDMKFEMSIQLSGVGTSEKTWQAKITSGNVVSDAVVNTDENGWVSLNDEEVKLGHNEQLTILGLPEGTTVTVKEVNVPQGFEVFYLDSGEVGDGVVTIQKNTSSSVEVINQYKPLAADSNIQIQGTKQIVDNQQAGVENWDGKTFTFELQRYNTSLKKWETVGQKTVTQDQKTFTFDLSEEDFSTAGDHAYQLFEFVPSDENKVSGMQYDLMYHTFHVNVGESNWDGKLEILSVEPGYAEDQVVFDPSKNQWVLSAEFTNVIHPSVPVTATIDIQKVLQNASGSTLASLKGYQFELYTDEACTTAAQAGEKINKITKASTDIIGEGWIDIEFNDIGDYVFYVKEVHGAAYGVDYSDQVVKVLIKVTRDELGKRMFAQVSYEPVGTQTLAFDEETKELLFTNTYETAPAILRLDATKKLIGRDMKGLKDGEFEFEFKLSKLNESNEAVESYKAYNNTQGDLVFVDGDKQPISIELSSVGTFRYQLRETSVDANGITTDKTVYNITVTVTDTGSEAEGCNCGKSHLKAEYKVSEIAGNQIVFENVYKAAQGHHTISGTKKLNGKMILNNQFMFELYLADHEGNILSTSPIEVVHNDENGKFEFKEMTFDENTVAYYVVKEKIPEKAVNLVYNRITFDAKEYFITLDVKDNGNGRYEVKETIKLNGQQVNEIAFENTYTPQSLTLKLEGLKKLVGTKPLEKGMFEFELYESDKNWTFDEDKLIAVSSNDEAGHFLFEVDSVSERKEYHYIVKEKIPQNAVMNILDGITYDDNYYFVRVTVAYDVEEGVLYESKREIFNSTGAIVEDSALSFVNTYDIIGDGHIEIIGTKQLSGREMQDGEFTFELYDQVNDVTKTAVNVNGKFRFELDYTTEDLGKKFVYLLTEQAGLLEKVVYDESVFVLTVEVRDDSQGGIQTILTIMKGTAAVPVEDLVFNNQYFPEPTPTTEQNNPPIEVMPTSTPSIEVRPTSTPQPWISPQTSDHNNPMLWLGLMLVSAAGLLAGRKKKSFH